MFSRLFKCLILVFALTAATVGCNVQFVNTPTDDVVVKDLEITGEYKIERGPEPFSKGTVSIQRRREKEFPYLIKYDMDGIPKDELLCQTYRFGKTNMVFVKYSEAGPAKHYFAFRIKINKDQIVANTIKHEFFIDNPNELLRVPQDKQVLIGSEPAQLGLFFKKHQNSKSLFDHQNPLILSRIKKERD